MATCKHCSKEIRYYSGRLWHDSSVVFPQYCYVDPAHGSRLHEPSDPIPQGHTYTIDEVINLGSIGELR
jgi:hypothetical protein